MPKPVSIICYICGREFGTKSIGIHEPQCMQKWEVQNNQLPKKLRQPKPVRPQEFDVKFSTDPKLRQQQIEKINEASNVAAQQNLIQCKYCLRTFLPDRIEKHEGICQNIKSRSVLKPAAMSSPKPEPVDTKPAYKSPQKKPVVRENKPEVELPKTTPEKAGRPQTQTKKTVSIAPDTQSPPDSEKTKSRFPTVPDNKSSKGVHFQNEADASSFSHDFVMGVNSDLLEKCNDCNKMVLRSVIATHLEKYCIGQKAKTSPTLSGNGGKFVKGRFVECINCGKSFTVNSLVVHQKKCLSNSGELPST